jgi:hypothetical protein
VFLSLTGQNGRIHEPAEVAERSRA